MKVAGADLVRPATSTVEGDAAPARPVVVIRLDATLIEAASPKTGARVITGAVSGSTP